MTSKQRFTAAVERRQPDRVPMDYQSSHAVDVQLRQAYGVQSERELLDTLGCDFYYLSVRDISQNETSVPIYRGPELWSSETERVCPFGIRFRREARADKFGVDEAIEGPLESARTERDILSHSFPEPSWFDVEQLLPECEQYADKVIIGGFWSGIFGDSYRMHGFQNFLLNMAAAPELIHALVRRTTDFYLELNERLFRTIGDKMTVFFMGNDFGVQNGLLFSEQMWLDFFYDPYRLLVEQAKSYGYLVMVHSCGSIYPLLKHFVSLGVDILDPVQTTASNMVPEKLKRDFGDRLVFHGAVDTQSVLPTATSEQVAQHVGSLIQVLGKNGGYILSSCNSIQNDTPIENVQTMYAVGRDYRPRQEVRS